LFTGSKVNFSGSGSFGDVSVWIKGNGWWGEILGGGERVITVKRIFIIVSSGVIVVSGLYEEIVFGALSEIVDDYFMISGVLVGSLKVSGVRHISGGGIGDTGRGICICLPVNGDAGVSSFGNCDRILDNLWSRESFEVITKMSGVVVSGSDLVDSHRFNLEVVVSIRGEIGKDNGMRTIVARFLVVIHRIRANFGGERTGSSETLGSWRDSVITDSGVGEDISIPSDGGLGGVDVVDLDIIDDGWSSTFSSPSFAKVLDTISFSLDSFGII